MAGKNIAAIVLAASIALPAAVFAQENPPVLAQEIPEEELVNCTCETTYADPPEPFGKVLRAEGSVFVTSADGYRQATRGMVLNDGTEVATSASGTAQLMVGRSCPIDIEPNRQVFVSVAAGKPAHICVLVKGQAPLAAVGPLNIGTAINSLVGFGTVAPIVSGGDDPASN